MASHHSFICAFGASHLSIAFFLFWQHVLGESQHHGHILRYSSPPPREFVFSGKGNFSSCSRAALTLDMSLYNYIRAFLKPIPTPSLQTDFPSSTPFFTSSHQHPDQLYLQRRNTLPPPQMARRPPHNSSHAGMTNGWSTATKPTGRATSPRSTQAR